MHLDITAAAAAIETHNRSRIDSGYAPGTIWGIYNRDGLLYTGSAGYRDMEKTQSITPQTLFRMASMTKPIVGVGAMQLVERGKLDLDAPVAKWIPEFAQMQVATQVFQGEVTETVPAMKQITPRMLLSHSSGLGCGRTYVSQTRDYPKKATLKESAASFGHSVLNFHPGTEAIYSAVMGMDVLARIMEMASDREFSDYLKENILNPLAMTDTVFAPDRLQQNRTIQLATGKETGLTPYPISPEVGFWGFREGWVSGSAGLFSTLDDYSRFARMLLGEGQLEGVQILKPQTVAQMATPQLPAGTPGTSEHFNWGLSVRIAGERGQNQPLPKGAYGWSGSFGTHFWVDPHNDLTCIYLMNLTNALGSAEPAAMEFEQDIAKALL